MKKQAPIGIYCIRNLITGSCYIGSAARSIQGRWEQHQHSLRAGKHGNYRLQADWRFYGEPSFRFSVLQECLPENCLEQEQHFIDSFDPAYNIARSVSSPMLGRRHSISSRERMSAVWIGHIVSKETREKISATKKSRPLPKEVISRLISANIARIWSPAARAKIRVAATGRKMSRVAKERMSASHMGHIVTPGTRAKISASHKARASHYT
jgi:group I intron endonuclease